MRLPSELDGFISADGSHVFVNNAISLATQVAKQCGRLGPKEGIRCYVRLDVTRLARAGATDTFVIPVDTAV